MGEFNFVKQHEQYGTQNSYKGNINRSYCPWIIAHRFTFLLFIRLSLKDLWYLTTPHIFFDANNPPWDIALCSHHYNSTTRDRWLFMPQIELHASFATKNLDPVTVSSRRPLRARPALFPTQPSTQQMLCFMWSWVSHWFMFSANGLFWYPRKHEALYFCCVDGRVVNAVGSPYDVAGLKLVRGLTVFLQYN